MGLTAQQKLYALPCYYLIKNWETGEIKGIISEENFEKLEEEDLFRLFSRENLAFAKINLNDWYDKGYEFLKKECLI